MVAISERTQSGLRRSISVDRAERLYDGTNIRAEEFTLFDQPSHGDSSRICVESMDKQGIFESPALLPNGNPQSPRSPLSKSKRKRKRTAPPLNLDKANVAKTLRRELDRPSKAEELALQRLKGIYEETVDFRDLYFDKFGLERAKQRTVDISDYVSNSLRSVSELGRAFRPGNICWVFAYRALILSVDSTKLQDSYKELQFAVRHLAHFAPLYISLADVSWELEKPSEAVACLERAVMLDRSDVKPLVGLSTCARLLLGKETDVSEKCRILGRMLTYAKEAVKMSPETGECWYNLGNALLVYCNVKAKTDLTRESLNAFFKASTCRIMQNKADFQYNFGMAHLLYGNYLEAIELWRKAQAMEPDWKEPADRIQVLVSHLHSISQLSAGKDRTFLRRIKHLAGTVPMKNLNVVLEEVSKPGTPGYKVSSLSHLTVGPNEGVLVHGKIHSIPYNTPDASRLIFLVDSAGDFLPVVIYNMGVEFSFGGSVSVPDPVVLEVNLHDDSKTICFRYIRVDEPWTIYHNFAQVPRRQCAQTVITTTPVIRS